MKTKVLLIADEKGFAQLLRVNLEETGQFEVRVENWAEDACRRQRIPTRECVKLWDPLNPNPSL